jgi:hypothetical protein
MAPKSKRRVGLRGDEMESQWVDSPGDPMVDREAAYRIFAKYKVFFEGEYPVKNTFIHFDPPTWTTSGMVRSASAPGKLPSATAQVMLTHFLQAPAWQRNHAPAVAQQAVRRTRADALAMLVPKEQKQQPTTQATKTTQLRNQRTREQRKVAKLRSHDSAMQLISRLDAQETIAASTASASLAQALGRQP